MKHLLLTIAAVLLVGTAFAHPIHDTATKGNLVGVQAELDKGVDVNAKGEWDRTPLHAAATNGKKEVAELLIAKGADVNAKESGLGTDPLHRAAFRGHEAIVELLIAEGADVNAKIKLGGLKGQTPLDIATHPDNPNASAETADLLRKHGGKRGRR